TTRARARCDRVPPPARWFARQTASVCRCRLSRRARGSGHPPPPIHCARSLSPRGASAQEATSGSALGRRRRLDRKELVPIEAVFAYIEAKHTLEIEGQSRSSLTHALEQAGKVGTLCEQRTQVPLNQIAPG